MAYQNDIHPQIPKWYAVITGPRHEKYVILQLQKKGIEAWTPILKKIRKYKTKSRVVDKPLLSRYVFVKIKRDEYVPVLEEQLVHSFLHNKGRIFPVKDEEIDILRLVSGEDVNVETTTTNLAKGDHVEVIYGDLTGLKGEITKFKGKKYVGVALETLGMHLLIEVPKKAIRRIEKKGK